MQLTENEKFTWLILFYFEN